MRDSKAQPWILWGVELSPYALKLEALLRIAELRFVWLPAAGPFPRALRYAWLRERVVRRRVPLTWPVMDPLDEFPQVPFLFGPAGEVLYDSSAIGAFLAAGRAGGSARSACLLPADDPTLRFAVRLIDEALDEVGLYLVHHNRWVVAARDNDAGARLARDMFPLLGPLTIGLRHGFPRRQVRRLPYLFSVAASDEAQWADLPARLRPPARAGFPPTHALLDALFDRLLSALEPVLSRRPFLFGNQPTLADTSVYGQLEMNRSDPSAWRQIAARAPATARWIERIAHGEVGSAEPPALRVHDDLAPLLHWIGDGFVPLMQQNAAAWARHLATGETVFNEPAFDAGRALYEGTLCGRPFRSVAKTFQVRVWRDLGAEWRTLPSADRLRLAALMAIDDLA